MVTSAPVVTIWSLPAPLRWPAAAVAVIAAGGVTAVQFGLRNRPDRLRETRERLRDKRSLERLQAWRETARPAERDAAPRRSPTIPEEFRQLTEDLSAEPAENDIYRAILWMEKELRSLDERTQRIETLLVPRHGDGGATSPHGRL